MRSIILGLLVALASVHHALADITIERIPIADAPPVLLIRGEFVFSDDPAALSREVTATGAKIVTFNSNGGNIAAAIAYGHMIRSLGLSTFQLRTSQCASACALAFLGGVTRQAEPGSIGVHQSSFSPNAQLDGRSAVATVQAMTAQIMTYLIEMGVDPALLQLSLSVPSEDMRYLTAKEMADYRVTSAEPLRLPSVAASDTTPQVVQPAQTEAKPAQQTVEDRALEFMAKYHAAWSHQNSDALAFMESAYADTVTFYGKPVSNFDVLTDKRKFADRWPKRAYNVKHGTETVACVGVCTVNGVVEWFAESPERGKMSSGAAEFTLMWDPLSDRIVTEFGKVLATDRNASGPDRIVTQWQIENGNCRGGSGDSNETMKACGRRDDIGAKLQAVGYCYDDANASARWHRCESRQRVASNDSLATVSSVGMPKPDDYPAREFLRGKTRLPDFKKRDRDFNSFRTRIRDGMREGPNFAGRYSLIQIGCGTGCTFVIMGDNQTGRPANFPRGGEDNMYLQLRFTLASRLLITQWFGQDQRCYVEFFDFNDTWKSIKKVDVGAEDACYRDVAENLR